MTITQEELKKLSNSLIGDQLAKVDLLVSSEPSLLNELVDIGNDVSLQDLKLDILFIALNLEEYVRDELGEIYISTVEKIFKGKILPENIESNDPLINYKYMRLVNLCAEFCPPCRYPYSSSLQYGLIRLINRVLSGSNGSSYVDDIRTINQLLNFFLHRKSSERKLHIRLLQPLTSLLREMAEKYSSDLHFNYAIRIKISKSASPASVKYDPFSNKGLEMNNVVPNAVNIDNPLDRRLLSLALALYPKFFLVQPLKNHDVPSLWDDIYFNTFATSLLKGGDINLRCSALAFLTHPYFTDDVTWIQKPRLKQVLLPYLVDCLNFQPLPWWFDPFDTLNSLIELYHRHEPLNNPVMAFLSKTNIIYGLLTLFAQCLSLKYQNKSSLRSTTKFIRLCASFAAYDELYRSLLLEQKSLLHHLEFGMEKHLKLLNEFLAHRQEIMEMVSKSDENLPPLYDHELAMAWLLLLKSFSRSVSALRTSLKRNKLAELLLSLLRTTYEVTQQCRFAGREFLKAEIDIMGITLGCICNFVVEFSNLQSFMLNNGIVKITGDILRDPLFKSGPGNERSFYAREKVDTDVVKTNALWVLRHLMYNCQNSEKLDLLSKIPMFTILEYINDPSWPVQEQCFHLIRNLTCNSRKVVNVLLENFKDIGYENDPKTGARVAKGTTYLFDYLARKIKLIDPGDVIQKRTLEVVLYIIVNLTAVHENKKELVIEQDEILSILQDILSESQQNSGRYGNDSKLKLASLWVLNNLLWNSTISHYTQYALEGYTPSRQDEENNQRQAMSSFASEGNLSDDSTSSDDKEDLDDADSDGNEFVHGSASTDLRTQANEPAIRRCKKLFELGMYDLVEKNVFDESLSVREKARTLQYHMDLLLKESPQAT